jgi:hypothetical protein
VNENIVQLQTIGAGQRYLVSDAGGGTVDLATYEYTMVVEHCQLAMESGGKCGSTILNQYTEIYLSDQVFIGCIEQQDLKLLVHQSIKEIKVIYRDTEYPACLLFEYLQYYFGDNTDRNN